MLTTAAKGIAEIITVTGYINVDFEDVRTVMSNSGKAIMGCARAEGEHRALEAVKSALSSPLLNDNEIEGASDVLLYITSGQEEISMDEVTEITDYIQEEAKSQAEIIWGNGYDESLGKKISITLIATGFEAHKRNAANQDIKIRHALNDEIRIETIKQPSPAAVETPESYKPIEIIRKSFQENIIQEEIRESVIAMDSPVIEDQTTSNAWKEDDRTFVFEFSQEAEVEIPEKEEVSVNHIQSDVQKNNGESHFTDKIEQPAEIKPFEVYIKKPGGENFREAEKTYSRPSVDLKSQERIERLRNLSMKLKNESAIEELENEPAYMRRNVELKNSIPSGEAQISRYSLYEDSDTKTPEIRSGNSYLHDNVD